MANKKISELSLHLTPQLSDTLAIVNNGQTKKITFGTIREETRSGLATTGSNTFIGDQYITGSIYITGSVFNTHHIQFNTGTAEIPTTEGELQWNSEDGTLDLGLEGGDVVLQLGQELHHPYVYNAEPDTIINGTLVMLDEDNLSQGQKIRVLRAVTDGTVKATNILGIATQDILSNDIGFITEFGAVRNIKISDFEDNNLKDSNETWAEGDILYGDPTRPGGLTNVIPDTGNLQTRIGIISTVNGNNANLVVNMYRCGKLEDVYDVDTANKDQGALLTYNSGSGTWNTKNNLSGSYEITGSVSITEVLNLKDNTTLPTGTIGDVAVSGSNLFFYNGQWNKVNLTPIP